ncbi:MAG: agglutinin biogenesis protein MshI [Rhodocyclaceae bacterium]|nr:MAG: agglutinin biogenesis protein MshI [Rhodocyclaceae bacterium]
MMMPLLRPKLNEGWLSVAFAPDRIDFAHIRRRAGKKPEVLLLSTYQRAGNDVEALTSLRKVLKLASYCCSSLLRVGEYQLLQVEPPDMPANELKEALRWRIKDMLSFPVESATIDVLEIPSDPATVGRARQVFAVAANNSIIAARMALFDDAKVPLLAIDIPEMAQRNISALFEEQDRGLAMLCCDESGAMLTFTFKGELYAARHTEVPLVQLQQAEEVRREQLFERISLEVQRSLDNFDRLNGHIRLPHLLVSSLPEVPGFLEYLRDNLSMPVVAMDLAQVLDFPSIPELAQPTRQSLCLKVLGAALRE